MRGTPPMHTKSASTGSRERIASLVEVLKEARKTEKRLVLIGLNAPVHEVLQLTRLTRIFEIRETEEAALES